MFHLCETTSWKRKTTRESAGHQGTSCFSWSRGLGSWCANFGIQETLRRTCPHMRCCRPSCCAARKHFKLLSRVFHLYSTWLLISIGVGDKVVLLMFFIACRWCCRLHDVVLECPAWSSWRHKEEVMWVGEDSEDFGHHIDVVQFPAEIVNCNRKTNWKALMEKLL